MQERILEEVHAIIENVNKDIDSGVVEHDFHRHTDIATGSVINAVLCGYRFSANGKEKEFEKLKETTETMMKTFGDPLLNVAIASDFVAKLPVFKQKLNYAVSLFHVIFKFMDGVIDEHSKSNNYKNDAEPHDFIDAYLAEMERSNERADENNYFSRKQLSSVALDLWFAGELLWMLSLLSTIITLTAESWIVVGFRTG